jgi:hypothetical protein
VKADIRTEMEQACMDTMEFVWNGILHNKFTCIHPCSVLSIRWTKQLYDAGARKTG